MKREQQAAFLIQWDMSSVNLCIVSCAIVPLLANVRLREIIVVDGLSIRGPRGASYIDRLQIDKRADTHTRAHICTQSCLAWKPIEAGTNINYLFFSRGLVTVIRVRVFWRVVHTRSNEENWPLYRAL